MIPASDTAFIRKRAPNYQLNQEAMRKECWDLLKKSCVFAGCTALGMAVSTKLLLDHWNSILSQDDLDRIFLDEKNRLQIALGAELLVMLLLVLGQVGTNQILPNKLRKLIYEVFEKSSILQALLKAAITPAINSAAFLGLSSMTTFPSPSLYSLHFLSQMTASSLKNTLEGFYHSWQKYRELDA